MKRLAAGAVAGLIAWGLCRLHLTFVPGALAFFVTAGASIFGWGASALVPVERDLPAPARIALSYGIGLAFAPLVMAVLAVCHAAAAFGPIAFALTGAMAARAKPRQAADSPGLVAGHAPREAWWYAAVVLIVFSLAAWASSGRLAMSAESIRVFGDYETFDLTFYAGIASGLNGTATFPPLSPFYAGHRIVYSYFPLLFLAGVHRTSGVPLTQCFMWFGWPFFVSVAAGSLMALFRRLGSSPFAAISTLLVFTGSSLAYAAAWLAPHMVDGDPLIWSSMFLAPSAEWLYFNPWAPTLAVVAAGLYATSRVAETRWRAWAVLAGLCFGVVFMFKSFAVPIVLGALGVTALVGACRRNPVWRRVIVIVAVTVLSTAPWIAAVLPHNSMENRGARVTIEYLSLVRRMLYKMDVVGPIASLVHHVSPDPKYRLVLAVGTVIFLVGGIGARWLGLAAVARSAIGRASITEWTPLAWVVILGIAMPFVIAIAPYPNSIQTYEFGLFLMWPFAVAVIWPPGARMSARRWMATATLIAASVPGTAHYLFATHTASSRPPLAALGAGGMQAVHRLRAADASETLLLHGDPQSASLYAIESGRPVALAWSGYVQEEGIPEVDALENDIAAFFGSADRPGVDDVGLLRRLHVTHVIERPGTDQLHPDVTAQLRLLVGASDARLYLVPPALRR